MREEMINDPDSTDEMLDETSPATPTTTFNSQTEIERNRLGQNFPLSG